MPDNRLIVSEKAVLLDELASMARPGDIVEGVVGSTMDWGVFVECRTGVCCSAVLKALTALPACCAASGLPRGC